MQSHIARQSDKAIALHLRVDSVEYTTKPTTKYTKW